MVFSCCSFFSPKDLDAINRMMISVNARKAVGKRLLADDNDVEMDEESMSPTKKSSSTTFLARKLENIIGERLQNQ